MPTLLEQPRSAETPIRRASGPGAAADNVRQQTAQHEDEVRTWRQKGAMKLREIFEGHEEFLGWTPD